MDDQSRVEIFSTFSRKQCLNAIKFKSSTPIRFKEVSRPGLESSNQIWTKYFDSWITAIPQVLKRGSKLARANRPSEQCHLSARLHGGDSPGNGHGLKQVSGLVMRSRKDPANNSLVPATSCEEPPGKYRKPCWRISSLWLQDMRRILNAVSGTASIMRYQNDRAPK